VLYETDANNNIMAEYTWDYQGNPVTMTKGGVTYYYHMNGHGDVTALTDANGNVVAQYQYDAWGNIISQTGTMASSNPYRYAGYRYDEETGLYYLMARYYDANIGRFITRDTFHGFEDDPQSLNLYTYTKNNPVMYVDPDGHNPIIAIIGLILRFATPLIKKYGTKYAAKIRNYAAKLFKNLTDRYRITSSTNAIVVILDKKDNNKRIFSLDYHKNIPLRNKRTRKKEQDIPVWHYHLKDPRVHYVFRWSIRSGYELYYNNYYYRYVW
jgi:RHS repeat-associated protein